MAEDDYCVGTLFSEFSALFDNDLGVFIELVGWEHAFIEGCSGGWGLDGG